MACGASQSRYNGNKKPADGTDPSASGNVLTDAMK